MKGRLALVGLLAAVGCQGPPGLAPGTDGPAFRLPALAGGEVATGRLRGRVVVLNFWATWCPPCVSEMPSLEKLHRALADEGLAVVGVSVDDDEAALRRFVEKAGLTMTIVRDPGGRVASRYGIGGYPETVVLDAAGRVVEHWRGPAVWHTPEALEHFRGLLKGLRKPGPGAPAPPGSARSPHAR